MGLMTQKDMAQTEDEDVGTIRPWKKSMRETVEDAVGGFFGGDYWANKTAKNLTGLADFVPVVGDAAGAMDTVDSIDRGDYLGASIDGLATLLGVTPVVGPAVSKGVKSLKKPLRDSLGAKPNSMGTNPDRNVANVESEKVLDKAKVGVENYSKILEDHGLKEWDGVGSRADTFSFKNDKLEVYTGYSQEVDGKITRGYDTNVLSPNTTVKSIKRILGYDVGPAPKIAFERGDIGVNQALMGGDFLKKYGKDVISRMDTLASKATVYVQKDKLLRPIKDGTKVGVRLNLNSKVPDSPQGLDKLQTLHKNNFNGEVLSFQPYATVENVVFSVKPEGRQSISAKILGVDVPEAKGKHNAMSVDGNLAQSKNVVIKGGRGVREIGFNPKMHHLFVDMETGQAVKGADVATVIGDRVYARGVKYWKKSEAPEVMDASDGTPLPSEVRYKFNQGGLVDNEMQALNFNLGGDVTEQLPEGYTLEGGIPKAPTPETKPVEAIEFGGDGPESLYEASKATGIPWKDLIKFNGGVTQLPANGILNIPADYAQTKVQNRPMPVVKKKVSPLVSGLADKVQSFKGWMEDKVNRPDPVRQETPATNTEVVAQTDAALKEADVAPPNMVESNIVDSIHTEIRQQENGVRAGWKEETGKWLPHPSAEGGLPTIGYGHKFATQEEADAMIASGGITEEQALTLFQEDMNVSESRAKKAYEANYKDRKWDSLDALGKLMLTEIAFNTGTLLENGVYNWPTLTKAIHDKDYGVASSQLNRTYTRKSDGKQVSLRGRTNALKAVYKTLLKDAGWTKGNSQASVDKTDYKNMIT